DHDIGTATVSGFAYSVIRQQPGDLAWIISKETAAHFAPWMRLGPGHDCLRQRYRPPVTVHRDTPVFGKCTPDLFSTGFRPVVADARSAPEATPLTRALHGYGLLARSTPVLLSASVLLTLAVLLFRRRRPWPATRDALLLTVTSLGMVVPTAVLMYDARYALPTLPLLCVAVGLALHQLLPKRSGEDVEPATGQASDGGHPQP
ncbi:MAG TPA: hypothetical protein VGD43_21225, partial [Micromonospora sp.]